MKNKALISLSFLALLGVSACSTSSQTTPAASTGNSTQLGATASSSIRPANVSGSSYTTNQPQNYAANQNEKKRLAYNYAWQKKQQQSRNKNHSAITDAQARRNWQLKQTQLLNQERGRASQQKRSNQQQRFAQQQKVLAKEYAAQQKRAKYNTAKKVLSPAQKYAAEQMKKQAQQNTHRQSRAQQYAAQQMKRQAQQMQKPKQTQQYSAQQQRQTFQYNAPKQPQAVHYAALQPRQVQQNAIQQRNVQQYALQQQQRQNQQRNALQQRNTQQYALQQRNAQQNALQQQRQNQQQALRLQQQNQQAQYLALLQPQQPNRTPTTPPRSNIGGLSSSEIRTIGDKIFRNESGGEIDKLVHWNVGENFASMGIGHFTWYPSGRRTRYGNTFPGLLNHLQSNGVQLPSWIQKAKLSGAPWRTKGELLQAKRSPRLRQFQNLLYETRYLQAGYIVERAKRAMPRLVKATPQHLKAHVSQNLNAVANTSGGWYALIDYVNFKGEGLNRKGGYKGQNWGLLQVLENMRPSQPGQMALNNFADSAIQTLERRIRNSNPSRGESRWMRGWAVRCNTYRQPFVI